MEARHLLDTHLALHVYCNKNRNIYLKSNIPKTSLIDYKYTSIYWRVLINRLLLDLNSGALEYGTIKSYQYCRVVLY